MRSVWRTLGIMETTDEVSIKKAYAKKAAACHPEDNPDDFQLLHDAYLIALEHAHRYEQKHDSETTRPDTGNASAAKHTPVSLRFLGAHTAEASPKENEPDTGDTPVRPALTFPSPASAEYGTPRPSDGTPPKSMRIPAFSFPETRPLVPGQEHASGHGNTPHGRGEPTSPKPLFHFPHTQENRDEPPEQYAGEHTRGHTAQQETTPSVAFPKNAWQQPPSPQNPASQTTEELPTAQHLPRASSTMAARESIGASYNTALTELRLGTARKMILDLLEKTRKSFPKSTRSSPWEYVFAFPEFALVREDTDFLVELQAFLSKKTLPTGIWPALAEHYPADGYRQPEEGTASTSPQPHAPRVGICQPEASFLFNEISKIVAKNLNNARAQDTDSTSWRTRIKTIFTRKQ